MTGDDDTSIFQASFAQEYESLNRTWFRRNSSQWLLTALWVAALVPVAGMFVFLPDNCWDLRVTTEALRYVRLGLDPYAASIAHEQAEAALGHRVFIYWYPPISILFLRAINVIPELLRSLMFWAAYVAGFGLQLWGASRYALPTERNKLRFLLPLTIFFPAFVPSDCILSGNLAIPMYGAIMAASVPGWRDGRWGWFYGAVLASSLLKPPMLVWLIVPWLIGSAQLVPSALAAFCGVDAFILQRVIWPERFASFMISIRHALPYETNYSAVGMFYRTAQQFGHPPSRLLAAFLVLFSTVIVALLAYFAYECKRGNLAGQSLAAIVLVSTAILAPRLKEYDLLPLTIPMALILLRAVGNRVAAVIFGAGAALVIGVLATGHLWAVDFISVMTVFLIGVYASAREVYLNGLARDQEAAAAPELAGV